MATDATGTVTTLGIPTFNVDVDSPSGAGSNAQMEFIDDLIVADRVRLTAAEADITSLEGSISGMSAVPAGTLVDYAGSSAPTGWLFADGTAVSRSTYATLFTAISTAFGVGDGSTTFNVPDLRGRVAVGKGTHADVDALNDSDGLAVGSRRPQHKHTVVNPTISITDPGHVHGGIPDPNTGADASGAPTSEGNSAGATQNSSSATTGITASAASGTVGPQTGSEPTDTVAYITVNKIIKT